MLRKYMLGALLIHTIVSIVSLRESGYWSPFPPYNEDFVYQLFSDLSVALGLILLLCLAQVQRKKRSLAKYSGMVVATILTGSFAPLVYLLWIEPDLFD